MSVTIKDIAREANVSHSTVSRAINNHPRIPLETRMKIQQLAEKMGYIPSAAARMLKTHLSRVIGVILSNLGDPFWSDVIQGIDKILQSSDYCIFLATTNREKLREKEVVQAMVQHGVDGVIVCAPQFSAEEYLALSAFEIPMVIINNDGDYITQSVVANDDIYGAKLATRHLLDLGHRNIAYIGVERERRTNIERETGFREEMQNLNIQVNERLVIYGAEETPAEGYKAAMQLLLSEDKPTAIVCYNDYLAVGVYSALYNSGYSIPDQISIVGFDDIELSKYLTPALTTVRQFKSKLGTIVATSILQQIARRENLLTPDQPERISIRGDLIMRGSTIAYPSKSE